MFVEEKKRKPISPSKQKQLLIRAKGKCENCGKILVGLKPFIHHRDGNPLNNKESNLMVLCPDCHYSDDLHVFKTVVKRDIFGIPYKERKMVIKRKRGENETKMKKSGKTKSGQSYSCKLPVERRFLWCGKKKADSSCLRYTLSRRKCPNLIISRK